MTTLDLEGLRALSEKATPGPWTALGHRLVRGYEGLGRTESDGVDYSTGENLSPGWAEEDEIANAAFIVAAVNYVRSQLAIPSEPGLGEAWAAAEAALPEGWEFALRHRSVVYGEPYEAEWSDGSRKPLGAFPVVWGPTPAAALASLTTRLQASKESPDAR